MLVGLIGGAIIGLGGWYLFRYSGKRYWSIGLTALFAGAGWISGMQKAPSVNSILGTALGFAIGAAFVGLVIGALVDLWRYFCSRSARSDDQKGVPHLPSSGDGSARGIASHELLGVSPEAGPEEITAAYQAMMQKHQSQSGPAASPSLPSVPHQDQSRSTTNHRSKTALNLAFFLGVPIAVLMSVVWLGSKSTATGSATDAATQSPFVASEQSEVHNVRMPNGTVIKNVPKDATKAQLLKKLADSDYDTNDFLDSNNYSENTLLYDELRPLVINFRPLGAGGDAATVRYQMRGPDGKLYSIDGPAGLSREVVEAEILKRAPKVKFRVSGPDGRGFVVQAPIGSSKEDAIIYVGYKEYGIQPLDSGIVPQFHDFICAEGCRAEE